jgi:hypothetical protein
VVSCAIYRHIADFTCAKLNNCLCFLMFLPPNLFLSSVPSVPPW